MTLEDHAPTAISPSPQPTINEAASVLVKMAGGFHEAIHIIQDQMKEANYAMVSNEPLAFISTKTLALLISDKSGDYRMTVPRDEDGPRGHPLFTWPTPAPDVPPAAITRGLLGEIVDEVFDGGIENASVIEDIYRVIVRRYGPAPQEREGT